MNDDKAIFIQAMRTADSLPSAVRAQAASVQSCERLVVDQSYLAFLREQIALEPRGPEWTAILAQRLSALSPFCDLPTIWGIISTIAGDHYIRVDPEGCRVIHHEFYKPTASA